jgi:hypothetical protein
MARSYPGIDCGSPPARARCSPTVNAAPTQSVAEEIRMPGQSVCHVYRSTDRMPARVVHLLSSTARAVPRVARAVEERS